MSVRKLLAVVVCGLAVVLADGRAHAAPAAFPDPISADSPNAAGRYLWLCGQITVEDKLADGIIDDERLDAWTAVDWAAEFVSEHADDGAPTPERWRERLVELQPVIGAYIEASRLDRYELYREPSQSAVPFAENDPRRNALVGMRQLADIVRDDAVRCWTAGDRAGAVERVAATLRAATQLQSSKTVLLHALVAGSIMEDGLGLLTGMGAANDDPAIDAAIRGALAPLEGDDPAGIRAAWRHEYVVSRDWIGEQLEIEGGGLELWMALGRMAGLRAVLDGLLQSASDAVEGEGDPDNIGRVDADDVIEQVGRDLGGLSVEDLRDAYDTARKAGNRVLRKWDGSGSEAERRAFRKADRVAKRDPTHIADLMGLYPQRLAESIARVVEARDRAWLSAEGI